MSENACCSHSRVVPKRTYDAPGHVIAETWACMDCMTEFVPRSLPSSAEKELQEARELIALLCDDTPCDYHPTVVYCREHDFYARPCPHERARLLLERSKL